MDDIQLPEPVAHRYFVQTSLYPDGLWTTQYYGYDRLLKTEALYTADQFRAAVLADRERRGGCNIVGWINEDALPAGYPYDAMYPHSRVDGVRMFPVFAPATVKESVTVQDEREWFEAWARQYDDLELGRMVFTEGGIDYSDWETEQAWDAWKTRAALAQPVADKLAEALRLCVLAIEPGGMPEPEHESLTRCAIEAARAALEGREPATSVADKIAAALRNIVSREHEYHKGKHHDGAEVVVVFDSLDEASWAFYDARAALAEHDRQRGGV